jgi:pyruvate dehydrogenase E2 component (dihydrolipoamide acetyltransferase)
MEEGSILRWHRQEGDAIAKGEILLEIDTDKAAVEVESPQAGVLRKILCAEGATVPVLAPIAIIAGAADDISVELSEAQTELNSCLGGTVKPAREEAPSGRATVAVPVEASRTVGGKEPAGVRVAPAPVPGEPGRMKASPAARKMAQDLRVDLVSVGQGGGPEGRILTTDVARAAAETAAAPKGAPRRALTGMRKAIARTMQASKQAIPHFYVKLTIDAGPLHSFYRAEKQKYPCTINDILTLACARVIREFPAFRSRLENEEVVEFPAASIGVAVGMDEGLVVPVVVGAEGMSLPELALETQRIVEAARNGKVVAMGQGVFTITNLGGFGVEEFSAIINPPEAAILAVGAMRESVIVKDGGIRPAWIITMTLSADHRLIDGLMAARFLKRLKEVLEAPDSLRDPVPAA